MSEIVVQLDFEEVEGLILNEIERILAPYNVQPWTKGDRSRPSIIITDKVEKARRHRRRNREVILIVLLLALDPELTQELKRANQFARRCRGGVFAITAPGFKQTVMRVMGMASGHNLSRESKAKFSWPTLFPVD